MITKFLCDMNSKCTFGAALAIALSTVGCVDSPDNSLFENRYQADFEAMLGGKIDKNQTWVTGTVIQANVQTSGEATVSVYTLGKETRTLYARERVNGSGVLTFAIPQNSDEHIAFEADYGDAEKVYRKMDLTLALKQQGKIDLTRSATTRADMAASNSVQEPNASICGESNHSTDGGYAGHHFGYTNFPGWVWDNLAKAVPEADKQLPHVRGQITNYELISTGPFYLSLIYGCTGTKDSRVLGYYYYKNSGDFSDLVKIDLLEVLKYDYIDGYAKVQYQRMGMPNWMDTNFDYKDGDGLVANKAISDVAARKGDNAFNTLLVNKEYNGQNGIQGVRGLTFQINVPIGYRLGFYLRASSGTCYSGAELNQKSTWRYRSIIQKFDGHTFMGLDDSPSGGDYDSNDVTFALTAGNGGSLPGVLLPGVMDLDRKQYYNNDGTITEIPKESYVQNVVEGRLPDDFGQGAEEEEVIPSVNDLPAWTIAYEDLGQTDDFDFNDVVIKVVPNTAHKAKVYLCATGGSLNAELHYNGPTGDILFGTSKQLMGSMTNTSGTLTKPIQLIGEVDWPAGYTMPTDAHRFYILVEGQKIAVNSIPGEAPKAICVEGDWQWPMERVHLTTAYPMVGEWGKNVNNAEARDWYLHPTKGSVISF